MEIVTVKGSDQSVTLNDLHASKLDSARASDNMFYPNTSYKIKDVNAPNQSLNFYFNDAAILGTSTEVDISIKDSVVSIEAGVFVNPNAGDLQNEAMRTGFIGTIAGVQIFESSNVDGTSDTDNCKGAVFSQDALALAMMQDLKIESQRDASLRADEIVATAVYGVGEIHDSYGVEMLNESVIN